MGCTSAKGKKASNEDHSKFFGLLIVVLQNPLYDSLDFYIVLVHPQFTTSKAELDFQYKKLYIRVTSRVIERLKLMIIRNKEILTKDKKCMGTQPKLLALLLKKYGKTAKFLGLVWLCLTSYVFPKFFVKDCRLSSRKRL